MEKKLMHVLESFNKEGMISFIKSHPEFVDTAIKLALKNKQPYSWRAAWLLWSCIEKNDKRIFPYISMIIESIKDKKDGHQRELLKILYIMELEEDHEGFLFDFCVGIWEKTNSSPSVRFNALLMIIRIAKKYPELYKEISLLLQEPYIAPLSPGIKNAVARIKKEHKLS